MTLEKLYTIIEDRKKNMPKNSYIASLFRDGNDRIIQKIGEEATEVIIAAKNRSKRKIVSEIADLWFHTLILLAKYDIDLSDILQELQKRHENRPQI